MGHERTTSTTLVVSTTLYIYIYIYGTQLIYQHIPC